jgi:hypothetical protein
LTGIDVLVPAMLKALAERGDTREEVGGSLDRSILDAIIVRDSVDDHHARAWLVMKGCWMVELSRLEVTCVLKRAHRPPRAVEDPPLGASIPLRGASLWPLDGESLAPRSEELAPWGKTLHP